MDVHEIKLTKFYWLAISDCKIDIITVFSINGSDSVEHYL